MKIKRDVSQKFNWILDNLVPPVMRDWRGFMRLLLNIAVGRENTDVFLDFKDASSQGDQAYIADCYRRTEVVSERETDINSKCVSYLLDEIKGYDTSIKILDIACGRGYLTQKIADAGYNVTGVDIILSDKLPRAHNIEYREGDITNIPCDDATFDLVICAHTVEHIYDIQRAIAELRRVCKDRLIIIVPRQREYQYTMDLHLHFFPYAHSVLRMMKNPAGTCISVGGDFVYTEVMRESGESPHSAGAH